MKLWLIAQDDRDGYDTYDSAVVAAETESEAKAINPAGKWEPDNRYSAWARSSEQVRATYIGEAAEGIAAGVVLASFNAG